MGQYNLYRDILSEVEPDRVLYLAIPQRAHDGIFADPLESWLCGGNNSG